MKKLAAVLLLCAMFAPHRAYSQVVYTPTPFGPLALNGAGLAGSSVAGLVEAGSAALFATVVFPILVTEGVPFPGCEYAKCEYSYPGDKARAVQVALSSKGFGKPYYVTVDGKLTKRSDGF